MGRAATYHKEDLRSDLLAAARGYVAQRGHFSLSLRNLALQVGVTTAAPYHHFTDRRALLLEVAVEGFRELIGTAEAIAKSQRPVGDKLLGVAESFLAYARSQPRLLELMYESELTTPELDPALFDFQNRGHLALVSIIEEAHPGLNEKQLNLRAIVFWSTIYGYALIRNKLMHRPHELLEEPADNVDHLVAVQAVGMALSDTLSPSL